LKWDVMNYKDLLSAHCPVEQGGIVETRVKSQKEELYPVEIVERAEDKHVNVHYVRYLTNGRMRMTYKSYVVQEVSSSSPAAKKSKMPVEVLESFYCTKS